MGKTIDWNYKEVDENSQISILKEKVTLANGVLDIRQLNSIESIIIMEIRLNQI